jgi:hypothetical protein
MKFMQTVQRFDELQLTYDISDERYIVLGTVLKYIYQNRLIDIVIF